MLIQVADNQCLTNSGTTARVSRVDLKDFEAEELCLRSRFSVVMSFVFSSCDFVDLFSCPEN